jgi:hypothetical protein
MPVPPPKNPGCPNFGVGMSHARSGGDALIDKFGYGLGLCVEKVIVIAVIFEYFEILIL